MQVIISDMERGFLFQRGKFAKMLQPGVYHIWGTRTGLQRTPLAAPLHSKFDAVHLALFQQDPDFVAQTITQEVPDGKMALHFIDGRFAEGLPAGKYTYWNIAQKHSFQLYDMTSPEVPAEIPPTLCKQLKSFMVSYDVQESKVGLLLYNGQYQRTLSPGRYWFWTGSGIQTSIQYIDLRKQEFVLNGQEILTKDKVSVRLNFVCSYQITDSLKIFQEISDYTVQLHTAVQLTVREYISNVTLDELLTQRDTISTQILERLRPKAAALYIEVFEAGIRDIILPGDVRDILNTVLIAEKKAQANVITRREEVASTRSLLNTAKLMDENKTLYKLKELEYLEKICENVGNISVSGGDLLENLRELLRTNA